jgi:hypothetical protein
MNNEGFDVPKHHCAVALSRDFADVVSQAAEKNGRQFEEQLVQFAIEGAEHSRLCKQKS